MITFLRCTKANRRDKFHRRVVVVRLGRGDRTVIAIFQKRQTQEPDRTEREIIPAQRQESPGFLQRAERQYGLLRYR